MYSSLNTSFSKNDEPGSVERNLDIICSELKIDYKRLVFSNQVHGDTVREIGINDIGKGVTRKSDIVGVDALITNVPGIPLITFYADCVPVYILDKGKKAVGLIHAGWKGTVLKIAAKALESMQRAYGTDPKDCLAAIGPSIEKSCYEVGNEVYEQFRTSYSNHVELAEKTDNDKYLIDLWKANKTALMEKGVPSENITVSGLCTKCNHDMFFSHRYHGENRGSLSAIIEII